MGEDSDIKFFRKKRYKKFIPKFERKKIKISYNLQFFHF